VTSDFSSNDSDRIEYLKTVTMEQHADLQRTCKATSSNGLETFTTIHIETLHYESYLMSTNCGPLGLKADTEPSTNRAALSDRSWAHVVHAAEDDGATDADFDINKCSVETKKHVNRIRVISCLMGYTLCFIKHIPHCRPNLTYANQLTDQWDTILVNEFNLPRPTKRKKIKRRMLFELFAVEAAVVEKFLFRHTAIDFPDMLPDENGLLQGFTIDSLVDVVRSLQRCLDHEKILNAWSHNLDHSPPTSSHVFQMKTVLAQLHGADLDFRTLEGELPKQAEDARSGSGGAGATQGRPPRRPDDDDEPEAEPAAAPAAAPAPPAPAAPAPAPSEAEEMLGGGAPQFAPEPPPPGAAAASAPASAPAPAPDVAEYFDGDPEEVAAWEAVADRAQAAHAAKRSRAEAGLDAGRELQEDMDDEDAMPKDQNGNDVCDRVQMKAMMQDGMTRRHCGRLSDQLGAIRRARCEYSKRLADSGQSCCGGAGATVLSEVASVMGSGSRDSAKANERAAQVMPTAQDVLASGIDDQFLKDVLQGKASEHFDKRQWLHLLGLKRELPWEYECTSQQQSGQGQKLLGPAEFDFNWMIHTGFTRASKNAAAGGDAGGGGGGSGPKKKSVWTNSTRVIRTASKNSRNNTFSLMDIESMTFEVMRDTLFSLGSADAKMRIPVFNHQQKAIFKHREMQSNAKKIQEPIFPSEVHPQGIFRESGAAQPWKLVKKFKNPEGLPRPADSIVGTSGFQHRLDHLNNERAIPVAMTPVSFTKGVPIKESDVHNGIYFNRWIAREHANLVVEAGAYMSRVPGVAGGDYQKVPSSFRRQGALRELSEAERSLMMAEDEASAGADAGGALVPASAAADGAADTAGTRVDDMPPFPEDEYDEGYADEQGEVPPTADEEEEDQEELDEAEALNVEGGAAAQREVAPAEAQVAADASASRPASEASADEDVEPEPELELARAQPGAGVVAGALSADEEAPVKTMPFDWDLLQMFLTHKMADTLHHDVEDYVKDMRAECPEAFVDEPLAVTLRNLPQVCLRFPGMAETRRLFPLSARLSLTRPADYHYDPSDSSKNQAQLDDALNAAYHSAVAGRQMEANDPEIAAAEAEQRGLGDKSELQGNLFSRSAWRRFTLLTLDKRGFLNDAERARVEDQNLCLRQRCFNQQSVDGSHVREYLGADAPLELRTFEAQERRRRENGGAEGHGDPARHEKRPRDSEEVLAVLKRSTKPRLTFQSPGRRCREQ